MPEIFSSSLIEGRLRRRSRRRSEVWRPAAAARNRPPREARDPAVQALRPGCEEFAVTDPAQMPVREARPRCQNRHGGAPRGERPASWDARRLARRLACGVISAFTRVLTHERMPSGCRCTRTFLGAPPPLDRGLAKQGCKNPGAEMRRGNEEDWLFDIVRSSPWWFARAAAQ
jgi:hypothetical protein